MRSHKFCKEHKLREYFKRTACNKYKKNSSGIYSQFLKKDDQRPFLQSEYQNKQ